MTRRMITWTLSEPAPLDFDGFLVRRSFGVNPSWDAATPLHVGVVPINQFDISTLPPSARPVAGP